MDEVKQHTENLESRLFKNSGFIATWFGFLIVMLCFVSWPVRNIALVCWVYGSQAYFRDGIYVLPGKPVRFSNGAEVPTLPDLITGFGAFLITAGGLTILLILGLRFYEKHFTKRKTTT